MKYCPECGSEYRNEIVACADCAGAPALVSSAQMRERGLPLPGDRDTRKFVAVITAEDPLSAEQYVAALEEEKITAFARPRRAGVVDPLTTAASGPWWEIVVPEEQAPRAAEIVEAEEARIEAGAEEAGKAAEEEEAALEAAEKPRS